MQPVDVGTILMIAAACITVFAAGAYVYRMGRKDGEAGYLSALDEIRKNKAALDAAEKLVESVPGTLLESVLQTVSKTYTDALRAFLPQGLQPVLDKLADITDQISDMQPNVVEYPPEEKHEIVEG